MSSCGSRVEIQPQFPPAADLKVDAEPAYPLTALQPGAAGEKAEDKWWTDVLAWGRVHHDRVKRICRWSRDLGLVLPDGYCG